MARAKRTDRTEARRRARAQQTPEFDAAQDEEARALPADASPADPSRRRGTAPATGAAGRGGSAAAGVRPARPGFVASARAAYHAPNLSEDLPYLPRLLVHWSVLVSAVLAVGGTALFIAAGSSSRAGASSTVGYVASMLVSLFVGPPPFGAALLIGFMLPRATYLVGLVFGALASICFTLVVMTEPASATAGMAVPVVLLQVWVLGLVGTMFFAGGIAWYRRFLDLLNPNRGQRPKAQQKPQPGRGNAPRNRLSGSGR